jgi:hypothetical protein
MRHSETLMPYPSKNSGLRDAACNRVIALCAHRGGYAPDPEADIRVFEAAP